MECLGEAFELKVKPSKIPISLSNTRDCFAYDLVVKETLMDLDIEYLTEKGGKRK